MGRRVYGPVLCSALLAAGCATLGGLQAFVRPPRFDALRERPAELRVGGVSRDARFGSAGVRLWARVENPNAFGLTLTTLRGRLHLGDEGGPDVSFPLGLPLRAREVSEVPIDLTVDLAEVPRLAQAVLRGVTGQPVDYRLEGTFGVDAGPIGQPTFGPMTILAGELRVVR